MIEYIGRLWRKEESPLEIDVPENMAEVEKEVAKRQADGKQATIDDVIKETVLASFQAYLEYSEEGHYDSGKWDGDNIVVTDIMKTVIYTVEPQGESFTADFKRSPDAVFFYLQDAAEKVAGIR